MVTVPEDINYVDDGKEFNPEKMTKLFNVGYSFGRNGINWQENISVEEYDNH